MALSLAARWQRISKRQQRIVIIVGSAAVIIMMDTLMLRPLRERLHKLQLEISAAQEHLSEVVVVSNQEGSVNSAYKAYESYIKKGGSADAELAAVLSEVEAAVRKSGMTLPIIQPTSSRTSQAGTLNVTVDGEILPGQLVELLDLIARSNNLLKVTELKIRVSDSKILRTSLVVSKLLL